jgi:hypothetical protein
LNIADLIREILPYGFGGALLVIVIVVILNPDKAERWAELGWAVASRVWRGADRQAVRHGLRSRVNGFAKAIAELTGSPEQTEVDVQWAEPNEEIAHFFKDNRLVMRLHPHERQDRNLVTASLLLVSQTLVRRSKRLLSKRQARSVDLYAVDRLLVSREPARALFHEEILGPESDIDPELATLIDQYRRMDRANLFFPVYVRELRYLGQKILVKPRDGRIIKEVKELVEFLVQYSERRLGEHSTLELQGRLLRCAIMIVAMAVKREIGDPGPYVRRLKALEMAGYETVYLVGSSGTENAEFMSTIAAQFCHGSTWGIVDRRTYSAKLKVEDTFTPVDNLLLTLRTPTPSDDIGELDLVEADGELPTSV